MTLTEQMTQLAKQSKAASRELAKLTTAEKNAYLLAMADALEKNSAAIKEANALDMEFGASHGLSAAMLDASSWTTKEFPAWRTVCARSWRYRIPSGKFSTSASVRMV